VAGNWILPGWCWVSIRIFQNFTACLALLNWWNWVIIYETILIKSFDILIKVFSINNSTEFSLFFLGKWNCTKIISL
jgi:hypothetical protein